MEAMNLQDAILKEVMKDEIPVVLYLMNGFQLGGIITAYDSFVVMLVTKGKQQMIYKHGISTLVPLKPLAGAARQYNSKKCKRRRGCSKNCCSPL